mmetsp:Transcript_87022/g.280875  ORF Transcript_87022/g.280875 Transcript_87022/m.280875 type:complete len:311 (-) Transcript_87022:2-934(-)
MLQHLGEATISLDLFLDAANATLGTVLRVEGAARVVLVQALPKVLLGLGVRRVGLPEALLRPLDQLTQPFLEDIEVKQVRKSKPIPDGLRGVRRADAALGGADGVAGGLGLQDAVDDLVAVEEDVRARGNENALDGARVELFQGVQLLHQGGHMANHAVADEVFATSVDDATRQQVEGILPPLDDQRMAGVRATIEARADLRILRHDVHQLPLALIAPLRAEHHGEFTIFVLDRVRRRRAGVKASTMAPLVKTTMASDLSGLAVRPRAFLLECAPWRPKHPRFKGKNHGRRNAQNDRAPLGQTQGDGATS